MTATMLTPKQPNLSAICLDTTRKSAGAVYGFMNSAGAAASSVSSMSIAFGYIVGYTASYDPPFIPMVTLLCVGVWVWLRVEPERQLFAEDQPEAAAALTL